MGTLTDGHLARCKDLVKDFPAEPGVYLMKDLSGKIIYVGKAKALRARVRSYFTDGKDHSPKTRLLVSHIHHVEYILTKTEVEAFLLEASLIKKHRPRYNIRLKDDKAYPYIRVSLNDEFPRLYLARRVARDGSAYFGPYTSGLAVQQTIRFLNQTFLIRDCRDAVMKTRKRPCLTHEIGRCTAPCVGYIDAQAYQKDVDNALDFLRGKDRRVIKKLTQRMREAARQERFEVAAKLRDSADAITAILEKQAVIDASHEFDQDVVCFVGDKRGTIIETLHIRHGRVIGHRPHYLPQFNCQDPLEDPREWFISFLNQYYEENIIPDEILVSVDLGGDMFKLLKQVLVQRKEGAVTVRFPTDEKGSGLLEIAEKNAQEHFKAQIAKQVKRQQGLKLIQEKLRLPALPLRIECYDISNFQGKDSVASQVVFEDGLPNPDQYRRYKIKTVEGANDFASMKEVLARRLAHAEWKEPDLIVIDGGKGQLNVVVEVLKELNKAHLPVVGLAKARRQGSFQDQELTSSEERFFLPNRQNPVLFPETSEALHILVGIRDEAHRFALNYHRQLRQETMLESELDLVVGLGEKRKRQLLKAFGSVEGIRAASISEIEKLRGFNRVLAERILLQLNESRDGEQS